MNWLRKMAQFMSRCEEICTVITFISLNIFLQKISEIENSTVVMYENVQNTCTKPDSHMEHQGATGLYEPVNGQPETPICVMGTRVQGQYDNIQYYENRALDKTDKKNVYDDLKITEDDHPYADMEVK